MTNNPFVTNGYVAPEYFCDREKETEKIVSLLTNENNVALIAPRRIGKTDLLHHCFRQPEIMLDLSSDTYETLLYQIPEKQRALFIAIASAGKAKAINGSEFVRKYHLSSASSVASAAKGLLEKDFITNDKGVYQVYDLFFKLWLQRTKL